MDFSSSFILVYEFFGSSRSDATTVPINREEACNRLKSTWRIFDWKALMKQHYFNFMQKILNNVHAEPVPPKHLVSTTSVTTSCWYLPHIVVYHPQKAEKIRVVFDSSAAETDSIFA